MAIKNETGKVLFIIGSLNVGGAESQMLLLASELVKRDRKVCLFSLEDEGPLKAALDAAGVRVFTGGYDSEATRIKKIFLLLRAQWRLYKLTISYRPKVLHAFLPLTNFMGSMVGRLSGVEIVVTSRRALGTHQDRHRWWAWFDQLANRFSTVITANSSAVVDDTVQRDQVDSSKIRLIYNGIKFSDVHFDKAHRHEARIALGLRDDMIALVFVANLIHYKGHNELICAFAQVYKSHPELRLFLIGEDRGIGDSLRELAIQHNVERVVHFLGRRADVPFLLRGMDIGIMASYEEGCSNALLEKLASGLPVIATSVGGNPEVMDGMPDCLLVPSRNVEALATGIEKILRSDGSASDSALLRIQTIKSKFSVEAMVDAHERIYDFGSTPKAGNEVS